MRRAAGCRGKRSGDPGQGARAPEKIGAPTRPPPAFLLPAVIVAMGVLTVGGAWAATPRVLRSTDIPILLVPGWFDTGRDLAPLRILLIGAGWDSGYVSALTFADPTGSNVDHAREIAEAARALLERTGARQLDIVAHSMGGLATRAYLAQGAPVRRVVFLASPHHGTFTSYLAWGDGAPEMHPGSPFLSALNAGPPVPVGVDALTVRTPIDTHVIPNESAMLPEVPDVSVCCPSHAGLLRDIEVFRVVRRFLADGIAEEGWKR